MKIYQVLELVLATNTYSIFLCYKVDELRKLKLVSRYDAHKVKEFISSQLDGYGTFESWLEGNAGIQPYSVDNYEDIMKITRDAWLVHMIEFCQEENI